MHVSRLRISGVRGFHGDRSVDLDLTRPDGSLAGWTVLAGRNGSGKSTLLQALALALAGPRAVPAALSLADWMSTSVTESRISADLRFPDYLFGDMEASLTFTRNPGIPRASEAGNEPDFDGTGAYTLGSRSEETPFFAGYGPFRHLGYDFLPRPGRRSTPKPQQQIASLFDETVTLSDAVRWLVEQHVYQLEGRSGEGYLLEIVMSLLGDGLLPDGFKVHRVDSDGLWVRNNRSEFALREMSDGYRAVTALVVDIVRQIWAAHRDLSLSDNNGVPALTYPGVIIIDEIDAHLHVRWQQQIGTWLKTHFPQIQFIVTTHSPYICQSADPGGLILLPGPGENRPAEVADEDLYHRVVYGSGDDVVLTELFGLENPYSPDAEKLRARLGDLEIKVLDGTATPAEEEEYHALSKKLMSSLSTRALEIAKLLGHDS